MAKVRDINEIIENKWIVEFDRKPFDKAKAFGFVLACNDDYTLIQILDKSWYELDGYCVFRNDSVKKFCVYDDENYFLNEVVKLKKLEPTTIPQVSIDCWHTILQTVNDNFNLVGVELELAYKNKLYIGKLEKAGKKKFSLITLDREAVWDDLPFKWELKHLTKVCFGSSYNNTLWEISESRKEKDK